MLRLIFIFVFLIFAFNSQATPLSCIDAFRVGRSLHSEVPPEQRQLILDLLTVPNATSNPVVKSRLAQIERDNPQIASELRDISKQPLWERWISAIGFKTKSARENITVRNLLRQAGRMGLSLAEYTTWILNPIPVSVNLYDRLTRGIYSKIQRNPNYKLNAEENAEVAKHGLEYEIDKFRAAQGSLRGRLSRLRKFSFNTLPQVVAVAAVLLTTEPSRGVTTSQYIDSVHMGSAPRVEVILDNSALPHTAIRVDGVVYSPSQTTLTASTVSQYFGNQTGIPRTMTTLALNLTGGQIQNLKIRLEANTWLNYKNDTGYYDCTTVVSEALGETVGIKIPEVINAYPSLMFGYIKASGVGGNGTIGSSQVITDDSFLRATAGRVLTTVSASVEAKLGFLLAPQTLIEQRKLLKDPARVYLSSEEATARAEEVQGYKSELNEAPEIKIAKIRLLRIQTNDQLSASERSAQSTAAINPAIQFLEDKRAEIERLDTTTNRTLEIMKSSELHAIAEIIADLKKD